MGKNLILITMLVMAAVSPLFAIIPHPLNNEEIEQREIVISEKFSPAEKLGRSQNLPQNVLVLMVEFADIKFADTITNQDYLADPDYTVRDYVGRFMFHLQTYYLDVSYDAYKVNYTVPDTIVTLSQPMVFYGEREKSLKRRVQMAQEVISLTDAFINFADYDAYILMHAGAGRESDLYGTNPNAISSSFINRRLMQIVLDPENDDFPGLETEDNVFIEELVISATNHNHPDNPEDLNYGTLGLLCHLFGRQMGLPTLFGNVASLGRAAGAGNFCLMGTGVWNANGFVPPFLSAWTRHFAGWAEPVEIRQSRDNLQVTYPFNPEDIDIPALYKVVISDDEYYLLENRQQNPDGSEINGQPSFTFSLLPGDEQDYYPPPFEHVPRFNFMKNTYRGCEWDFYLPGLGGPEVSVNSGTGIIDGSGILIWHIDEIIIREEYENNRINADPNHQGVTLQEADGIQHLRSSMPDILMRGSPYDSFRRGHNDYFGRLYKDAETLSLPYVQSYYGDIDLEIGNISRSHNVMSFSVTYPWMLEYASQEKNIQPVAVITDDNDYLLQTTNSGEIYFFEDFELLSGYPVVTDTIPHLFTYLEDSRTFIIPVEKNGEGAAYYRISPEEKKLSCIYSGFEWATHPIALQSENSASKIAAAFKQTENHNFMILFYDEEYELINMSSFQKGIIASNMMQRGDKLLFFIKQHDDAGFLLQKIDLANYNLSSTPFHLPEESEIRSSLIAPITKKEIIPGEYADNIIVLTTDDRLYLFDEKGEISPGFPVTMPQEVLSVPGLGDVNRNGFLDILLNSSENIFVVGYNGELLNYPAPTELPYPEEEQGNLGLITLDLTGDGNLEILANLGGNRFVIWDNNFRKLEGYPLVLPTQPKNYPLPVIRENSLDIYLTSEKGSIYRQTFTAPHDYNFHNGAWLSEYGNLQRTAGYDALLPENVLETEEIFLAENCYAFPVPVTYQNGGVLYFNIMVNQNLPVEVKIFDISGRLIFKEMYECQAYTNNRNKLSLDINGLATGVYFAILKAKNETLKLRFAVER